MSDLVFDPLDHGNNFTVAVRRLVNTTGKTVKERNKEVDTLIEQYINSTGEVPHPDALDELADYILQDDLSDMNGHKAKKHYSFLSDRQFKTREHKELPLDVVGDVSLNYMDYGTGEIVVSDRQIKSFITRFKTKNKTTCVNYSKTSVEFRDEKHKKWADSVKRRDDYTCQCCGSKVNQLHAHHIEAFNHAPDLRYVLKNGIALCNWCHDDFHDKYGRGFNTRKQLEEWLQDTKVS